MASLRKTSGLLLEQTPKDILPRVYQFLFIFLEPTIILLGLLAIIISPSNFTSSLAPSTATGTGVLAFLTPLAPNRKLNSVTSSGDSLTSPQALVLIQQFMSALLFSAIVEPLVLYTAVFRFQSVCDAERLVRAVLAAFTVFDVLHAAATLSVVGFGPVVPGLGGKVSVETCANVWIPMVWVGIRSCWFAGVGRQKAIPSAGKEKGF